MTLMRAMPNCIKAMCLLLVAVRGLQAASVSEAWVQRYSNSVSNANDTASKVICDPAGDIIVTGWTGGALASEQLILKYSGVSGAPLWQRKGTAQDALYPSFASKSDVATDSSGNIIVTGSSFSPGSSNDFYTAKYSGVDGSLIWEIRYNGPANSDDRAQAVVIDPHDNVIVTGNSDNGTNTDHFTVKYTGADGSLLWERRHDGGLNDYASAVAVDANGNVVMTGASHTNATNFNSNADFYTAKYAGTDGSLIWEHTYDGPASRGDGAVAVAIDRNGDVAVTGNSDNGNYSDLYTAKYRSSNGVLIWEKRYSVTGASDARAISADSDGNVIVAGNSAGTPADDYYTAKYAAADGALLWEKRYNGAANSTDEIMGMSLDASGNVVVTGFSGVEIGRSPTCYTAKYAAADGSLLWETNDNGIGGEDAGVSVAVDGSGNAIVVGRTVSGGNSRPDCFTAKYSVAGSLLWEQSYSGPSRNVDLANAVAVDHAGNVVVTGSSLSSRNAEDYYTAKYAAFDGRLLWEQRYNGPAVHYDLARSVVVDLNGDVIVTGSSVSNNTADFYTAKYRSADGQIIWERRYDGPDHRQDDPMALALDSQGNVVVTGRSANESGITAFYTAKYSAADGNLIWEQRYEGVDPAADYPTALAIDADDNIIVTGISQTNAHYGPVSHYYTAKYARADGQLLWQDRRRVSSGSGDGPPDIAVDPDGNVIIAGQIATNRTRIYICKYAAADGSLLWEHLSSPAYLEVGRALAVDGEGCVVVTGYSYNGTNIDFYTAKYAAADGALLWEKRYNGPMDKNDEPVAVALDSKGNVVVTGHANYDSSGNADYYTAKYSSANGKLIWEKYHNDTGRNAMPLTRRSLAIGPGDAVLVTGTSRQGTDNATYDFLTVKYVESPTITRIAAGGYRLELPSNPGQSYVIQRANTVTGPWLTLASVVAPPTGFIIHSDVSPPSTAAFYRLSAP